MAGKQYTEDEVKNMLNELSEKIGIVEMEADLACKEDNINKYAWSMDKITNEILPRVRFVNSLITQSNFESKRELSLEASKLITRLEDMVDKMEKWWIVYKPKLAQN